MISLFVADKAKTSDEERTSMSNSEHRQVISSGRLSVNLVIILEADMHNR